MTNLEINIKIAEQIFGHEVVHRTWNKGKCYSYTLGEPDYYDSYGEMILSNPLPDYCEDIKSAWEVVDKIRNSKTVFSLTSLLHASDGNKLEWIAKWEMYDPDYRFVFDVSESAPKAICLASLKILEK